MLVVSLVLVVVLVVVLVAIPVPEIVTVTDPQELEESQTFKIDVPMVTPVALTVLPLRVAMRATGLELLERL